ncbi:MAG: sterol desaturase [Methylocystaceae bacterium]|nr:MAG: sterol desaturase [Methylocystaceae bacterium]
MISRISSLSSPTSLSLSNALRQVKHWLWDADLRLQRRGLQLALLAILAAVAMLSEFYVHGQFRDIPGLLNADHVKVLYGVKDVDLSRVEAPIAATLVKASVAAVLFAAVIGLADVIFYHRLVGRPFDWESMINISVVNNVFLLTVLFTFVNPLIEDALVYYDNALSVVPTIVHLNGFVAIIIAGLIADFCYYWSHRWGHKIRLFWNLGHVNHHRSRNLTQLTYPIDPPTLFLNIGNGKVFVLVMLPVLAKVFSTDIHDSGWALAFIMIFEAWTTPSHSVVLYYAELRSGILRALRWIFVTPAVHFTHHSREDQHNISDGCNFGARFTLWDRIFGTYVEPPPYIPATGLFSDDADYCNTPLRYLFHPYVRMFQELRRNNIRYWPAIIFGRTSYDPPVPVRSSV